jgi:hypothetical protein
MGLIINILPEFLVLATSIIFYPIYYKKHSRISFLMLLIIICTYFGHILSLALQLDKTYQLPIIGFILGFIMFLALLESERVIGKNIFVEKITLNIPQFADLSFVVDNSSKKVAWSLFIETITRITTQPLENDSGKIREALTSLFSLFNLSRELLKGMNPSSEKELMTVEMLAISMLNKVIRPRLSKWHKLLSDYEKSDQFNGEDNWEQNNECRKDLEKLRLDLIEYSRGFAELAKVKNLDFFFSNQDTSSIAKGDSK